MESSESPPVETKKAPLSTNLQVSEEIGKSKYNSMIGLADRERFDEELYDDFETAKAREKRLAKEARIQENQAKLAALGKKLKEPTSAKAIKGRAQASFHRVTCK